MEDQTSQTDIAARAQMQERQQKDPWLEPVKDKNKLEVRIAVNRKPEQPAGKGTAEMVERGSPFLGSVKVEFPFDLDAMDDVNEEID